ncbi:hypothetical protein BH10CYA1_BH10CYA1_46140 [soil metagenome]
MSLESNNASDRLRVSENKTNSDLSKQSTDLFQPIQSASLRERISENNEVLISPLRLSNGSVRQTALMSFSTLQPDDAFGVFNLNFAPNQKNTLLAADFLSTERSISNQSYDWEQNTTSEQKESDADADADNDIDVLFYSQLAIEAGQRYRDGSSRHPQDGATNFNDEAGKKTIWGDPHLVADDGTQVDDQIEAGKNILLLNSKDGNSIVGETSKYDLTNKDSTATVFDQECITLSGGNKVIFKGDGTAYHYDAKKSDHLGSALRDGETVQGDDPDDKATYNAGTKTLSFTFQVGVDRISGNLQGNDTHSADYSNYVNTKIEASTGRYGGLMPAMKTSYGDVETDTMTGAGAFTKDANGHDRTNEDFYVKSLYGECGASSPPEKQPPPPPEKQPPPPPEKQPPPPPEKQPPPPPEKQPPPPPEKQPPPEQPPQKPPGDTSDLNALLKVGKNVSQSDITKVQNVLKNTAPAVQKALRDMKPKILLVTDAEDPNHISGAAAYWDPAHNLIVIHAGTGLVSEAADHEFWHVADTRFGITDDIGFQQAIHKDLQNGALSKLGSAKQILVDPPYVDGVAIGDIFAELGPDIDHIDDTGIAGLMGSSFSNARSWLDNWRKTHAA